MRKKFPLNLHRDAELAPLPMGEIRAILRGADPLIGSGGRTLLTKLLKGSHSQDVLRHGLEKNPSHGFYRHLTSEEILDRIDWTILNRYLRVEYDGQLPMVVYTPLGWSIECETFAEEIMQGFAEQLASPDRPYDMLYLKDRNRELILRVLEKIESSGDRKFVPILEDWARIDYKKVRQEINRVIQRLTGAPAA